MATPIPLIITAIHNPKKFEIKPVTAIPPEASKTPNVIYNGLFFLSDNIPING